MNMNGNIFIALLHRVNRSAARCWSSRKAGAAGVHLEDWSSTEAVQPLARVNVTCVTPLGEEVASTS